MSARENIAPYREPPQVVVDVLDAPPTPLLSLSPDARWLVFVEHSAMPSLADVARPMARLAGLRIDPATNAHHQTVFGLALMLRDLKGERERRVVLPEGRRVSSIRWSHDARRFACLLVDDAGTSLWVADVNDAELTLVTAGINAVLSGGFEWMPDGVRLLASLVPPARGERPAEPPLPRGPKVLEARGDTTPLRTYQDLLQSEHDEQSFEHFARSELVLCDPRDGSVERLGEDRMFWEFESSPDGEWLLVSTIERPFSFLHPYSGFPQRVECWGLQSRARVLIADVPTAENVPIEGVRTGPRHVMWSAHGGARLVWLEALDGGDPRRKVPHRDRWMRFDAPFTGEAREFLRLEHRASGLSFLKDADRVLARDYDRDRRWTRLRTFKCGENEPSSVLDDRSARDRYGDPGSILFEPAARGRRIVRQRGEWIFRFGNGDSADGPRPFAARQSLATLATERLFQSGADEIESPVSLVDDESGTPVQLVTRHESALSPPNLRLRRLGSDAFDALTAFTDPAPILRRIEKRMLSYERADGVQLSGELYLPPGWNGERLPIVLWAYPHDYVDQDTASQNTASKHRFTRIGGPSHLFFALLGYAVLDDASMPIVGDPETMNDTFVDQAVSSARAAIEHLDAIGVGDPARVGVGGHSYGAFMTACLLAHSDLFKAGIARSGAYNRTLTPFGFQAERRTLWEAPDSYVKLSPFLSAHTIKAPLLLVHGEKDENPGTHYLQTERLFHAIKGTGGTARFVSLPHEGHGYRARESILHVLAEQIDWFDTYLKAR
ncbi:MAG: S9 family peptidase [Planctomycetes bacterium]|nr:S9 family peptidase [Planctomycetota bacterium]